MEVTVGEEGSTAGGAEDVMEGVEEGFAGVEVSTPEATLGTAADIITADIVAATTEVTAATAGAEDIGAEDTVTAGAGVGDGDLALGGLIGDGDIRMPTTARGIYRPTPFI